MKWAMTARHARDVLRACNVNVGADFHALAAYQIGDLLQHADKWGYREPRGANGSRARYFHAMLERRASAAESAA